jgi:TonB family protein
MKTAMIAALATLAAPAGAGPRGEASPPLAPTGKWNVEYTENLCALSHVYGEGDAGLTLGFRPWPMGDQMEIIVMARASSSPISRSGKATLSLSPSGKEVAGEYSSFRVPNKNLRVTTMTIKQDAFAELGSATAIGIAYSNDLRVSVTQPPTIKAALAALDKCEDELLRKWGVDPAEKKMVATPPQAFPGAADWITDGDYPGDARRSHEQGTVMILWTVGIEGRVTDCLPVITSGTASLDRAACSAIIRRGRFKPALDKDGKPMISHYARKVAWRLPG